MAPSVIDIRRADDLRDVVHRAVQALAEGQIVAFPTETVYGLAASARCEAGVERLLKTKQRGESHPLALAIKSADDARDYVPDLCPLADRLARRCWPGPVTLVLADEHADSLIKQLPASVQAAVVPNGTVGLRVPAHPLIHDVLRMLAGPLALTSANRSGQPDSTAAQDVVDALGEDVDMVLDDGPSRYGQPSSVVKVSDQGIEMLRVGVVAEQTLRRLSSMMILFVCTGNTCRSPMAEAICRQLIAQRLGCKSSELEERGVVVASAGISAAAGGRAAPEANEVLTGEGLSLADHVSQPLTETLIRQADLVFSMTASHRQAILAKWPEAASRVRLLRTDLGDVSDPIGGSADVYRNCAEQIKEHLARHVAKLELK